MIGENWLKWSHRSTEGTEGKQIDKEKAIEFLMGEVLKYKSGLGVEILHNAVKKSRT